MHIYKTLNVNRCLCHLPSEQCASSVEPSRECAFDRCGKMHEPRMRNTILHKFLKSIYAPLTRIPLTSETKRKRCGCVCAWVFFSVRVTYNHLHCAYLWILFSRKYSFILLQFKIILPTSSDLHGTIYSRHGIKWAKSTFKNTTNHKLQRNFLERFSLCVYHFPILFLSVQQYFFELVVLFHVFCQPFIHLRIELFSFLLKFHPIRFRSFQSNAKISFITLQIKQFFAHWLFCKRKTIVLCYVCMSFLSLLLIFTPEFVILIHTNLISP